MEFDYIALAFWLHACELVGIVILGFMQWLGNRQRATKDSIAQAEKKSEDNINNLAQNFKAELRLLDTRLDNHNDRLIVVEQNIPSDDKWKGLYERIGKVEQEISGLRSGQEATGRLVRNINNHLIDKGK